MAITWLIEWRMRSSCSLSLVFGRWIAGASWAVALPWAPVVAVVVATLPEELDAAGLVAVTAVG
jgi:hypothetical protein